MRIGELHGDRYNELTLDTIGNVTADVTSSTTTRGYAGQKLTSETVSGSTTKSFYDSQGNLDCTTLSGYGGTTCPVGGDTHLKVDYLYDYRNRLVGTRSYSSGTLTAHSDIQVDALDRPVAEDDNGATTTFAYTGTSNRVAKETTGGSVKRYGYGAYGERLTITDGAGRYSYLFNPHGDVSLMIDQANAVKQAYGYTAYGGVDPTITKSAASFTDPNPYRYTSKRWDTATNTYDMGARRYSPATTRWLQEDIYYDSLNDLRLAQGPLTGNRYQFTGANPINYVESDGHKPEGFDGSWATAKQIDADVRTCYEENFQGAACDRIDNRTSVTCPPFEKSIKGQGCRGSGGFATLAAGLAVPIALIPGVGETEITAIIIVGVVVYVISKAVDENGDALPTREPVTKYPRNKDGNIAGGAGPGKGARLSADEEQAVTNYENGLDYDPAALARAKQKLKQQEKYLKQGQNRQRQRRGGR